MIRALRSWPGPLALLAGVATALTGCAGGSTHYRGPVQRIGQSAAGQPARSSSPTLNRGHQWNQSDFGPGRRPGI